MSQKAAHSPAELPKLTARQQQVLDYINRCIDEEGIPPTMREIGRHMGIKSTNGVNDHLKALERKGYIKRDYLKSRSLRTSQSPQTVSIPLVGDVAAGIPVLAVEHASENVRIDRSLLSGAESDVFALRVSGDSMIEDGIFDRDYIFVKKQNSARKGETVVALIDDEATVKRYYPETNNTIRLQPANSSMEPIFVNATEGRNLQILGTVVGVFRQL